MKEGHTPDHGEVEERKESDITLSQLTKGTTGAIRDHLGSISDGGLPEDHWHSDTKDMSLYETIQLEKAERKLANNAITKLSNMGIRDIEELSHRPDLIHALPEHLSQLERVVIFNLVLKSIHPGTIHRHYNGSTVESRTLPKETAEDHTYRLIVNSLRNFANDVPSNADAERIQVKEYAEEILERLQKETSEPKSTLEIEDNLQNKKEEANISNPEQIPFDKMKDILGLNGNEQFEEFRDWVRQLDMVDATNPSLDLDPLHTRRRSRQKNEIISTFLPERLEFIKELGEACLENGSVISVDVFRSSLDQQPGVVPYIALNVKLRGNKGEIFDSVILERPERVQLRNLVTHQVSEKTDDATYIFVSEIPGIWRDAFYKGAEKKAVRYEGAARRYHTVNHVQNVLKSLDKMVNDIKDGSLPFPHTNPYK